MIQLTLKNLTSSSVKFQKNLRTLQKITCPRYNFSSFAFRMQKDYNDQKPINICITGAAGQIAYNLIPYLCNGLIFGSTQKVNLSLLDIEKASSSMKGLTLELQDCDFPNLQSVTCTNDLDEAFKDCDYAIFLGSLPLKPGMTRRDLLSLNQELFVSQGNALDRSAKKTCKVFNVSNPANTICWILMNQAKSIPRENFTSLTRIDHNRAQFQLADKAGVGTEDVNNVAIWGNHSSTLFPDYFNGTINEKPVSEIIKDQEYLKNQFIHKVQNRAWEIADERKYTSVLGTAHAICDHLIYWIHGTPKGQFTSMSVVTDNNPYGIEKDLIYSFPVQINNGQWKIVEGLEHDQFAWDRIRASEKELIDEKNSLIKN